VGRSAKFAVPVAGQAVEWARLHERLTAGMAGGTPLIAATAGWGKTTLAGSLIAAGAGGRPAAWVSLDRADDDESAFWRVLATALLPVAADAASAGLRRVAEAAVDMLQRMSGAPADRLAARRALVDPLTEREQTVMRYCDVVRRARALCLL
jgi:ATP/maltotriose-dependent transcriptional regulator MalT